RPRRRHDQLDLALHLPPVEVPQLGLELETAVAGLEAGLEAHPVDGHRTQVLELDRTPQAEWDLPLVWLAEAHVGGGGVRPQLAVVVVAHDVALAVELGLD